MSGGTFDSNCESAQQAEVQLDADAAEAAGATAVGELCSGDCVIGATWFRRHLPRTQSGGRGLRARQRVYKATCAAAGTARPF